MNKWIDQAKGPAIVGLIHIIFWWMRFKLKGGKMKTIYEHAIGGDGAVAGLYVDGEFLIEQVKYPLAKALDPADKFVDSAIDGLEAKIPGDWDKVVLEPVRIAAKAELQKLVGG